MGLWLSSCSGTADEDEQSAKEIEIFLSSEQLKARPHLKIKTAAFDHDFMFYGSFIPMLKSPSGYSLKGRIIRFQLVSDRVIMLESPKGHSIADESESTILLAEFPIVQSDSEGVVIDFAKGMSSAFTSRNVNSEGLSLKDAGTSPQFKAIALAASFVKAITNDEDVLTISQIAQWRNSQSELVSAEFRYFIREYAPSPDFKKKSFGKHRWVQYFSTPELLLPPTTETIAYIAKWSIEKPLIFYISANTPAPYRDAVKDGILFWNHIFGKNIIEVRDLAPDLSAPHPRLNIIQWVPWDNEASAYADMVVDHLTGEALQAQIFLRSGWVFKATKKLRSQLAEILLSDNPSDEKPIDKDTPLPSMLNYEEPCMQNISSPEAIGELLEHVSKSSISDAVLKTVTADIVRTVVAHEMGHVMGLRHNLAGSTAATMGLDERNALLKEYLLKANAPLGNNKSMSASIMDVFTAADDAIMGSQIRELINSDIETSPLKTLYPYDSQAIAYGYFDQPMKANIPFCYDQEIPLYLDCQRWDASNEPFLFAAQRLNTTAVQIAVVMAETMISALDPERKGGPVSIKDIQFINTNIKKSFDYNLKQLFSWFSNSARSIQMEAKGEAFSSHAKDGLNELRFQTMREQLLLKGVNKTLFSIIPPFRDPSLEAQALANKFMRHFITLSLDAKEKNTQFVVTEREIKEGEEIANKFFATLNDELIILFSNNLARVQFDDIEFQEPLEQALGEIVREIVLKEEKAQDYPELDLPPKFVYSEAARLAALQLLNPAIGSVPDWSFDTTIDLNTRLKALMKAHSGTSENNGVNLSSVSREQRQWLLQQNRLLTALAKISSLSRENMPQPKSPPPK